MTSCEFTVAVTALANAIAEGLPQKELILIAATFTQLGDTLAVIAAQRELCSKA